ncbi:MAG TPA: hypothetical protein VGF06_09115, partial [Terriglobales bacterium]
NSGKQESQGENHQQTHIFLLGTLGQERLKLAHHTLETRAGCGFSWYADMKKLALGGCALSLMR